MKQLMLAVLLVAGLGLAQEKAVVFDFQPMGVDTATTEVAAMLLRGRLADLGAFRMADPPVGTKVYTTDEALAAAGRLGVDKVITGTLARIGLKIINPTA